LGASRLHRRIGARGEFLAQRWRAVEIKQALAGVVGRCGGFRNRAPLTAGDDSLKACARPLNVGHVGPHHFDARGAYQDSKIGPPSYSDTVPIARAYIKRAPERMVWASDWPHPTEKDKPNDAVLFDLLTEWAPDEATRTRILVQNPATLYGFPRSV
jgi:hypothetical protein